MNKFLLGCNILQEEWENAMVRVSRTHSTAWSNPSESTRNKEDARFSYCDKKFNFFLFMDYSSEDVYSPKKYLAENNSEIVFYSGLPIDPSSETTLHDANKMLNNFNEIKYGFEGQAALFRFDKNTGSVDIITDTLGMEQVYYCIFNKNFFVSNDVSWLERLTGNLSIDLTAAAYFLSTGWVGSNRTLRENINVIDGGQHWVWDSVVRRLSKKTYFDISEIIPNSREVLSRKSISELIENFSKYYCLFNKDFSLECPLTGGYDSRIVASVLINQGIDADYYTSGFAEDNDVKTASLIAQKFDLHYEILNPNYELLIVNWHELVSKFILENYGMVNLWQMNDVLTDTRQVRRRKLRLSTFGSEIARMAYNRHEWQRWNITKEDIFVFLRNRILKNQMKLLNPEALKIFDDYMFLFFKRHEKINHKFLPDLFFTLERVGRHDANNWRKNIDSADLFSAFCTKTYLRCGLGLHPLHKITYPLHYRVIKRLNKEMLSIPLNGSTWPVQNVRAKILLDNIKKTTKKYSGFKKQSTNTIRENFTGSNKLTVFKKKLNTIRSVCFDQSSSEIWKLLNKDKVEKMFSDENHINYMGLDQLYTIATLFYYSEVLQGESRIKYKV